MKRIVLTAVMLCAALVAFAQSFSEIELNQARAVWLNSGNAAGISTASLLQYMDLSVEFEGQKGDFKHSYSASSQLDYSLKGNAVAEFAGFKLTGDISLNRSSLMDVPFNSSIYEVSPFLKPYWFLDNTSTGYDWNRGNYAANVNVASPLMADDRLAVGLNFKADTRSAVRNSDISASYGSCTMEFAPSAIFRIDEYNTVGLAVRFSNTPEHSNITTTIEGVSEVALARGLGLYQMRHINGVNPIGEISYKNNSTGVSLQYDRLSAENGSDLLLNLGLSKGNSFLYSGERNLSAIDNIITDFSLTHLKGEYHNRIFTLAAKYHLLYGYDNTSVSSVHSLESTNVNLLLDYVAYLGAPAETYSWFIGLRADASLLNQKRYLPEGSFKAPETLASVVLGKNSAVGDGGELMCSLRAGYHFAFGTGYSYGNAKSDDNVISTMLYDDECYYLRQYYYLVAPQVRYSTKVSDKLSVYGLLQGSFIKPVDAEGTRLVGGVSLGILF